MNKKIAPGFNYLNITQFLDALNENLFKYIVIYFLIFFQGIEKTPLIMSLTGSIFILPFILFSSLGGIFADRWSKTSIIRFTRCIQLIILIAAILTIYFQAFIMAYFMLFLMSSLSAIFGPSKYGIIPELVTEQGMVKANSYIAAFTFFGIILGTSLASFLHIFLDNHFYQMVAVCLIFTVIGIFCSLLIPSLPALNRKKHFPYFIYQEIVDSLREMKSIPFMLLAVFAYSYFLFFGAFVQMNIVPFSIETLHLTPIAGGYLFVFSAIGIGIGAILASKTSGKLTILPKSCLGISLSCFLFPFFPHPYWINILWLILLGIFGGLFLVPSQVYILSKSPEKNRGRNFGTANFFSFVFALIAAGYLFLLTSLFRLSASQNFTATAFVNFLVTAFLYYFLRKYP